MTTKNIECEGRRLEEPKTFLEKIRSRQISPKESVSKNNDFTIKEFDPIIFLTPIWNGYPAPVIDRLLDKINLKGKRVLFGLVGANQTNVKALERLRVKAINRGCIFIDDVYLRGVKQGQNWSDIMEEDYVREVNRLAEKVSAVQGFRR